MRVGAIDCGTNSIRLLVADVPEDAAEVGSLADVVRRTEVVRLGQGVDQTGRLDPEALERTLRVAAEYAQTCQAEGVSAVRFVATSASRDASNADEFFDGVRSAFAEHGLEVAPEVISGDEEADLAFAGATSGLGELGIDGPVLVVDIGGGSTELVRGTDAVAERVSLDIGSVRLTERHLRSDPPTTEEVEGARWDIATALDHAETRVGLGSVSAVVGLAGSVATVTAHAFGLRSYDHDQIHLARMTPADVLHWAADLLVTDRDARAALPYMHPGRVDVIGAGALIWHETIARVAEVNGPDLPVITSEKDILDGIAFSAAAHAVAGD
ncbi:Ppx/GppA phosphatase family protein [Marihabitans asiaticum]|uniref:Exopolyphosphatase/guanosine-5'-triphosphate, 3'-diphosphate pyrophosphatase n=1 Tax=Marihabitans asiaticum TaxID=415218 RepID=A0A560WD65_9MICO|nr:Ppx/GppA phosphatase family protein [Marihabitans asiaticum]TWD15597.1 exopolyphosphatase/guanosine-5'-triphosphate,3'-diphosphate pyrophosphatase [Marihabitans asiaticum]